MPAYVLLTTCRATPAQHHLPGRSASPSCGSLVLVLTELRLREVGSCREPQQNQCGHRLLLADPRLPCQLVTSPSFSWFIEPRSSWQDPGPLTKYLVPKCPESPSLWGASALPLPGPPHPGSPKGGSHSVVVLECDCCRGQGSRVRLHLATVTLTSLPSTSFKGSQGTKPLAPSRTAEMWWKRPILCHQG